MTGDEIRRARERAGLTQEQLGRLVGVSLRTIGNWERGATPISARQQARLQSALGLDAESDKGVPLSEVSDVELLAEIARRFARAHQTTTSASRPVAEPTPLRPHDIPPPAHGVAARDLGEKSRGQQIREKQDDDGHNDEPLIEE